MVSPVFLKVIPCLERMRGLRRGVFMILCESRYGWVRPPTRLRKMRLRPLRKQDNLRFPVASSCREWL